MLFILCMLFFYSAYASQICDNSATLVDINFASGQALIDTVSSTTSYTIGLFGTSAVPNPRISTTYGNSLVELQLTVTGSDVNINLIPVIIYDRLSSRQPIITRFGYTTYIVFTGTFNMYLNGAGGIGNFSHTADTTIGAFNDTNGIGIGVREIGDTSSPNPTASLKLYLKINETLNAFSPTGATPTSFTALNLYRIAIVNTTSPYINLDFYDGYLGSWQTMRTFTNTDLSPYTVQSFINFPAVIESRWQFDTAQVNAGVQYPFAQLSASSSGWISYITGHDQSFTQSLVASVNTTEQHIITIKNGSTFGGTTNNTIVQPINFASLTTTNNSFGIIYTVYKNATVTGTSYQNQDAQNSAVQYTTVGTYSIGTGTQVFSLHSTSNSGDVPEFSQYLSNIYVSPGDTLTITGKTLFGQTDSLFLALGWKEAQLLKCYGN